MKLSLLVAATLFLTAAACSIPGSASAPPAYTGFLQGKWDEGPDDGNLCAEGRNLRSIIVASDGTSLTWKLDEAIDGPEGEVTDTYSYRVLGHTGSALTLAMEGETRTDSRGEPVAWELVAVASGKMRWRATDFRFGGYNNVWLVRCSEPN